QALAALAAGADPEPPEALLAWLRCRAERPGTPFLPWLLHQAAQALLRQDAVAALAWVRRALAHDPELSGIPEKADLVRAALPELERLARAQALAEALRFDLDQPAAPPGLLAGMAEALDADPQGRDVLAAAVRGGGGAARAALDALAGRDDLTPD